MKTITSVNGFSKKLVSNSIFIDDVSETSQWYNDFQSREELRKTINIDIKKGILKRIHKTKLSMCISILEIFRWKKFLYKNSISLKIHLIMVIIKFKIV